MNKLQIQSLEHIEEMIDNLYGNIISLGNKIQIIEDKPIDHTKHVYPLLSECTDIKNWVLAILESIETNK